MQADRLDHVGVEAGGDGLRLPLDFGDLVGQPLDAHGGVLRRPRRLGAAGSPLLAGADGVAPTIPFKPSLSARLENVLSNVLANVDRVSNNLNAVFDADNRAALKSTLADLATVNLAIDVQEDTEIYTPLTSRIAHLVVIDVLAMGVAMARGPGLVNHLKSVKRSLRSLRLSPKAHKNVED